MCVTERVQENVEPVLDSLYYKGKREIETPDNVPNECPSGARSIRPIQTVQVL